MSNPKDKNDSNISAADACWRLVSRTPEKYGDTPDAAGESPAHGFQEAQMSALISTIESEIIPRLIANHDSSVPSAPRPLATTLISQFEVQSFTCIALEKDCASCLDFIESLRMRGITLASIYLDLLGPAARELGGMWTRDECDFTAVTVSLWRIQQVMYDLSPEFRNAHVQQSAQSRRIMLAAVPGSQHTLGILMVAEFFRKAGWRVWGEPLATSESMIAAVSEQHFDVLGISIGSEPQLEGVKDLIAGLRDASANPRLVVMAGGPVFGHHPEYAGAIGADIYAMNAQDAVFAAEKALTSEPAQHARFFERGS